MDEVLDSEDCPGASNGSADVWFDAMAALAHATNDSGAFGINRDTLDAARKKFSFFLIEHCFSVENPYLLCKAFESTENVFS